MKIRDQQASRPCGTLGAEVKDSHCVLDRRPGLAGPAYCGPAGNYLGSKKGARVDIMEPAGLCWMNQSRKLPRWITRPFR